MSWLWPELLYLLLLIPLVLALYILIFDAGAGSPCAIPAWNWFARCCRPAPACAATFPSPCCCSECRACWWRSGARSPHRGPAHQPGDGHPDHRCLAAACAPRISSPAASWPRSSPPCRSYGTQLPRARSGSWPFRVSPSWSSGHHRPGHPGCRHPEPARRVQDGNGKWHPAKHRRDCRGRPGRRTHRLPRFTRVAPAPVPKGDFAPDIIVLLTDGASNVGPAPLDAARQAADRGLAGIYHGFGTANGSEFPNCNRQFQGFEPPTGGSGFGGGGFGSPGGGSGLRRRHRRAHPQEDR